VVMVRRPCRRRLTGVDSFFSLLANHLTAGNQAMALRDAVLPSTTVVVIVVALVAVQVAIQVYAIVDLARRDEVRGGRKWVWALVVTLGNLPGAIAYLVAGRPEAPPPNERDSRSDASTAGDDAARRAVDMLYNPRER